MKNVKSLLLIIACTVILFLVFYFQNKVYEKENAYNYVLKLSGAMQMKQDVYNFNFEINNKMTGLKAPNVSYTTTSGEIREYFLSDLISKQPILLFRYADINCNTCYESAIKEFQTEFIDSPELTGILCTYLRDMDLTAFKRLNVIKLPMYRISSDAFDW